jgi:predicted AAA+ superfamily ATPase
VERAATLPHAVIVSGLRRVGKSTLQAQLTKNTGLYDFSVKRQQIAPKKTCCIDSGLPITGKLLENVVFLALRQQYQEIYYYTTRGGCEVDYYLPEEHLLGQVTQNLNASSARERELRALADAIQTIQVKRALILSEVNEKSQKVSGVPVEVRSTAEWLLSE